MTIHFDSEEELISRLQDQYSAQGSCLIGIDGVMGTGKTHLARALSAHLGGRAIQFDDYHPGNGAPYVARLDVERLSADISSTATSGPTILDGICFLNVLDRLAITVECFIYVLPRDPHAVENDWLDDEVPLDEVLRLLGAFGTAAGQLDQEIAIYTRTRRPQHRAAFTFRLTL